MAVGVLTGVVAMALAGLVANLGVGWYRVSPFEGASGFFVVGMALLGLLIGVGAGIVVSRIVAGGTNPSFMKALGLSQGLMIGIIFLIGLVARLMADVEPTLNGETMRLAVEFRWPEGRSPDEVADTTEWRVQLLSSVNRTARAGRTGPVWREDARLEGGRWVVPSAVDLFTGRGDRVIDVLPDGVLPTGFVVPLPGRPGKKFLAWSEWLPRVPDNAPTAADGFRYRFRVVPSSQPIRTEAFGPFEVVTIASGFGEVRSAEHLATYTADAQFLVRHRGQPVIIEPTGEGTEADTAGRFEMVGAVAALGGAKPALLVQVGAPRGEGPCYLVMSDGDSARTVPVGICGDALRLLPLTSDPVAFDQARHRFPPAGRFDRATFAIPGQYLLRGAVLDTRQLTVRNLSTDDDGQLIERIPPLGVSPDGHSFVRIEWAEGSNTELALVVDRLDTGERYHVPVDRVRTRFADLDLIDPAWVLHYFSWGTGPNSGYRLVARANVVPMPYRGWLAQEGSYREYRLAPAFEGLQPALIEFLVTEFAAEKLPVEQGAFSQQARIGQAVVSVSYDATDGHVGVWMSPGGDSSPVATIAERFDAALRTGRYDHLFAK